MSQSWVKTEDHEWVNLEHAYWVFVKSKADEEGLWPLCAKFNADAPIIRIASYQTEDAAIYRMDEIMINLALRKN